MEDDNAFADGSRSSPINRVIETLNVASTSEAAEYYSVDGDLTWAQQLADELLALSSIYDEEVIELLPLPEQSTATVHAHREQSFKAGSSRPSTPSPTDHPDRDLQNALAATWVPNMRLRLAFRTELEARQGQSSNVPLEVRISATLPGHYPCTEHPPQLQLLNRFVGGHAVDHVIFGKVLRCFLHDEEVLAEKGRSVGLKWVKGESILFEALDWVKEAVEQWYDDKEREHYERSVLQENEREAKAASQPRPNTEAVEERHMNGVVDNAELEALSKKLKLVSAPAITERKSAFVGHCCKLEDPSQVFKILDYIKLDKWIARATHPTIYAFVCTVNGVTHRDCDDDGESAAGGRLAHLLQILNLDNVLVVVTRSYGGILLGPDRFKFINRAARDALELAGFV